MVNLKKQKKREENRLYELMMDYIHPASPEYDPVFVKRLLKLERELGLQGKGDALVVALLGDELSLEQKKLLPRR